MDRNLKSNLELEGRPYRVSGPVQDYRKAVSCIARPFLQPLQLAHAGVCELPSIYWSMAARGSVSSATIRWDACMGRRERGTNHLRLECS